MTSTTGAAPADATAQAIALVRRIAARESWQSHYGKRWEEEAAEIIAALSTPPVADPSDAALNAGLAVLRSATHPDRGLVLDVWRAVQGGVVADPSIPADMVRLNGFRCHNCKDVFWTPDDHAPKRCDKCRCSSFSAVYPSPDDPMIPAGMKPWHGRTGGPPDDVDHAKSCMSRDGKMRPTPVTSNVWLHVASHADADIIAYTPRPHPVADTVGEIGRLSRAALDAALDAEWAIDAGGDVPAVGASYTLREVLEEFGANLSSREIENAIWTALKAAMNPPPSSDEEIMYDREGPR